MNPLDGPVVLFGGGGFVGQHLLKRLENAGVDVRLPVTITGSRADIASPVDELIDMIGDAEVVVNAAGRAHIHSSDPRDFWSANAIGPWHVAQAVSESHSVRRLVHVSSVSVGCGGMTPPATAYQPFTAYGASKAAGELAMSGVLGGKDLDLIVIRPAGIGGEDSPGAWGTIRRLIQSGRPVPVPQNDVRHDVIEIDDVVTFLHRSVLGEIDGGVYTLAGPGPVTLSEYAQRVGRETGRVPRLVHVPHSLLRVAGRAGSVVHRACNAAVRVEQLASTLTEQRPLVLEPSDRHRG